MQQTINNHKHYIKELLLLAIPLFIGNLGHTLIGATDVLVVARYGINSLAAISIANSIIFTIFILGIGVINAVSIILSHNRGENIRVKKYLPSTLIFSLFLSIIFTLICYGTKYVIPHLGFEEILVPYICEYIAIVSFSMFGIFLFEGIKQFLQAYEIVKLPNLILLFTVVINLIFDIIFVFGFYGIPAMGSKGAAIATLSVRTLMGLILFIYVFKYINWKANIDFAYMKHVLKIGLPIGFALVFEFLAFNIITLLIAREAGILAAVHSILITIASATYMVPMAISTATSVKVAFYYGAKIPYEIKMYSLTAMKMCLSFMVSIAIILALFPKQIINLFTDDIKVIEISLPIISIVAVYQIFDGLQSVTCGILRGFKMTKTISLSVLLCYWAIGAPVAYLFVYKLKYSLEGYWIALAISLCTMGILQTIIAKWKYKKLLASKS